MGKVAILVDGGFYLKRAHYLFGEKTPKERAKELFEYCLKHVEHSFDHSKNDLYRIFYYDCRPSEKSVFHPLTKKSTCLKNTVQYKWATEFQKEIICKRKVALRLGELLDSNLNYMLTPEAVKKLCNISNLTLFKASITLSSQIDSISDKAIFSSSVNE